MKLNDWLNSATKQLEQVDIDSARLDSLVLLEDALKKDRAWILANPSSIIQKTASDRLSLLLKRREKHEPLAYIRGKTEFYGREFLISKDVLVPRPESETMIELLKELADSKQLKPDSKIADIGTGSGALAITAKLELPKTDVLATDIDKKCLKNAKFNSVKHRVNVKFFAGYLLEPLLSSGFELKNWAILANLPYVPNTYQINQAATNEPRLAIFGGPDGLDLYRRMFEQLSSMKNKPKFIFTESLPAQHQNLAKNANQSGYKQAKEKDFIQLFRLN